jgi:salicylate hydroxylase
VKNKPRILIAGAGLGGLTAALALLKKGFDVEVFERASDLKEVGAGVQLAANGSRVLQELGLDAELRSIGTELSGKEIRLWNTGRAWNFLDLGATSIERYGAPYLTLHRADLHDMLVRAVRREKPDAIRLNASAAGFEQSGDAARLILDKGEAIAGDALIGADGVHSKIRQALFGEDRATFTGCMAWRGLVSMAGLPETITRSGGTFWLGPGAHIVTYPVRSGEELNFIGIINRDDWKIESWTTRGTTEECLSDFTGWHSDVQAMVRGIAIPYKWALVVREPLGKWSVGRVSLLGDAGHSTLPLLAQGANMSLEDGLILARCLDKYRTDVVAGLKSYEAARLGRTTKIVRASADQLGRNTHDALSDPATAEAHIEAEWQKTRVNDRYDWVYGYDATGAAIQ